MSVAFDVSTRHPSGQDTSTTSSATLPTTFSHAAAASGVKAIVLVLNCINSNSSGAWNTVTYGGVAMTLVRTAQNTAHAGRSVIYVLLAGIPQGTQTVSFGTTGSTSDQWFATCTSITAAADVEINAQGNTDTGTSTDQAITLTTTQPTCTLAGMHSGQLVVTAPTPKTGCTRQNYRQNGSGGGGTSLKRASVDAAGNVNIGMTAPSSVSFGIAAVALSEVAATQRNKTRVSGSFTDKPSKVKSSGTMVSKPTKVKVGGTFL